MTLSVQISYPNGTKRCDNPRCDRYAPQSDYCQPCDFLVKSLARKAEQIAPQLEKQSAPTKAWWQIWK
jgi:hypothetical protein